MKSLERAYSHINSGVSLICEEMDALGLQPISDDETRKASVIPAEYAEYFVPDSGKARWASVEDHSGTWAIEFSLKMPMNSWTDGTEDRESTFDYIEKQIKNDLPQAGGVPGEAFCNSHAIVSDELSNNEVVVVRCFISGGRDV